MKLGRTVVFIISIAAGCCAQSSKKALLIGNDSYPISPLQNARNDAKALGAALSAIGYATYIQLDQNLDMMERSIDNFAAELRPGDTALVFYAGHGIQSEGQNYLIPTDFHAGSDVEIRAQAYALGNILAKLAAQRATTKIIILDACRNNPFSGSRSMQDGWAPVQSSSAGTFIAFGTAPGSVASDDPRGENGLFTEMILRYLSRPLEVYELFQKVRADVIRESKGLQVPWVASSLISAFYFGQATTGDIAEGNASIGAREESPYSPERTPTSPYGRSLARTQHSNPKSVNILVSEGALLAEQHDYDEAVRSLSEALTLDPRCSVARRLLGLIFHILGRSVDAIKEYDQELASDPLDYRAYYYRCLVTMSEAPAGAARDCGASIGLEPKFAEAHSGLAMSLLSLGQIDRSYSEVNRSLLLRDDSGVAYAIRGKISVATGNYSSANQDFRTAARLLSADPLK